MAYLPDFPGTWRTLNLPQAIPCHTTLNVDFSQPRTFCHVLTCFRRVPTRHPFTYLLIRSPPPLVTGASTSSSHSSSSRIHLVLFSALFVRIRLSPAASKHFCNFVGHLANLVVPLSGTNDSRCWILDFLTFPTFLEAQARWVTTSSALLALPSTSDALRATEARSSISRVLTVQGPYLFSRPESRSPLIVQGAQTSDDVALNGEATTSLLIS